MRRRELLAGLGSVGALAAGGAIAVNGLPSMDGPSDDDSVGAAGSTETPADGDTEDSPVAPITIETIDAPGSKAGQIRLPAEGEPTFIDFFATWCSPCEAQMPALAEAHDRVGDDIRFVSVTWEGLSESEIAEWWDDNEGNWTIGRDPTAEVTARYNVPGIPYAVAIDEGGTVRWTDRGQKTADEFVAGIEQAL
jgi:thiol-disulfide isomerase/thioredoxin